MTRFPSNRSAHLAWLACGLLGASLSGINYAQAQTCTLHLSQPQANLGKILPPQAFHWRPGDSLQALGTRQFIVNVLCPAATPINLVLRGARQAEGFRFAARGKMDVQMYDALLDGVPVALLATDTLPVPSQAGATRTPVLPGQRVVPMIAGQPAQGSHLMLQMEVSSAIPLSELDVRESTQVKGRIELEVNAP